MEDQDYAAEQMVSYFMDRRKVKKVLDRQRQKNKDSNTGQTQWRDKVRDTDNKLKRLREEVEDQGMRSY